MLNIKDIRTALKNIRDFVHKTPLIYSNSFSKMTGADVYLKAENLQKTGSFKVRGAFNKMTHIRGNVIAASMGNHAQAVAFAAGRLGINAKIVMPVGKTKVVFIVETRSKEHLDEILLDLTAKGFKVRKRTNG